MKTTLMNEAIVKLLRQYEQGILSEYALLEKSYKSFCRSLAKMTESECSSCTLRSFEHIRIELECLQEELSDAYALNICNKSLAAVKMEMQILRIILIHPEFVNDKDESMPISPLYLNKDFCLTDFVEIITPCFELGVFTDKHGHPAMLKTIIRVFERAFNLNMPNYDKLRYAAVNRKINLTCFLDRLRCVLEEISKR